MSNASRILLFYDGTIEAKSALIRCASLSIALSATVDVVAVVDCIGTGALTGGTLSDVLVSQLETDARSALSDAVDELRVNGIFARGHVVFGQVADAMSRMIEQLNFDLVVVGHRVKTGFERWYGGRPLHLDLLDRLRGVMVVTVTPG